MTWVPLILGLAQGASLAVLLYCLIEMRAAHRRSLAAIREFRLAVEASVAEADDFRRRMDDLT